MPDNVTILPVQSCYFGGNVGAAGLLTISDFEAAITHYNSSFDVILLPSIAFNSSDEDLTGRSLFDWSQQLDCEIILL